MIAKHVAMRSVNKSALSRLVGYIVDTQNKQERLGAVLVSNCASDEPLYAATEILNTQAQNVRAKSDKTYHLIISFRSDERPDDIILHTVEERLCAALGFEGHQRISAVHRDTDNLHIHIAINKIHPTRYTLHEPFNDFWLLARSCEQLENEFGLAPDNHLSNKTASENRAADMEHHAGTESLIGWIQRGCADQMRQAQSWDEMHDIMRSNGLRLHARGNGLAITAGDGTSIKASSIGREYSKAGLESRLGSFTATPDHMESTRPDRQYAPRPIHERIDTTRLYAAYRQAQQDASTIRTAGHALARRRKNRDVQAAKRTARLKRAAIRITGASAMAKKLMYAAVGYTLLSELASIAAADRRERAHNSQQNRRRAWADWLQQQAMEGDDEALLALRARPGTVTNAGDTLTGSGIGTAGRSNFPSKDSITKHGTVVYQNAGTIVRDYGSALQVTGTWDNRGSQAILFMAIDLYGSCIHVAGSQAFRTQMAQAAAATSRAVTFDDETLDKQRRTFIAARLNAAANDVHATDGSPSASAANPDHGRHTTTSPFEGDLPPTSNTTTEPESDHGQDTIRQRRPDSSGAEGRQHRPVAMEDFDRREMGSGVGHGNPHTQADPHQSDAGTIGGSPPPSGRHRMRALSELGVVHIAGRGQVLLQGHVPDHVEQPGAAAADKLRRSVPDLEKVSAEEAARRYVLRAEREREADRTVAVHRMLDGAERKLSYVGMATESGHVLALLRENGRILVAAVDDNVARTLGRKRPGSSVRVRENSVVSGRGKGRD